MNTIYPITKNLYKKIMGEGIHDRELVLTLKEGIRYYNKAASNPNSPSPRFDLTEMEGVGYFMIKYPEVEIPIALFNGSGSYLNNRSTCYSGAYLEKKYHEYIDRIKETISDPDNFSLSDWQVIRLSDSPKKYRRNVVHRIKSVIYECGSTTYSPLNNNVEGEFEVVNKNYPKEVLNFSLDDGEIIFDEMEPTPVNLSTVVDKLRFLLIVLNFNPKIITR